MDKKLSKTAQLALGFGLMIGGIYAVYKFINLMADTINPTVTVAIITAISSVASLSIGKYLEKKKDIEREIREKKIPLYNEFVEFLFKALNGGESDIPIPESEMILFMKKFSQIMIVWGSDDVMNAWIDFRTLSSSETENELKHVEMAKCIARIILAIRKDIGHKNTGMNEKRVLATFINGIDDFIK